MCLGCGHEAQQECVVSRWEEKIEIASDQAVEDEEAAAHNPREEKVTPSIRTLPTENSPETQAGQKVEDMLRRFSQPEEMQDELQQEQSKTHQRYKFPAGMNKAFKAWKDSPMPTTPVKAEGSRESSKPADHSTTVNTTRVRAYEATSSQIASESEDSEGFHNPFQKYSGTQGDTIQASTMYGMEKRQRRSNIMTEATPGSFSGSSISGRCNTSFIKTKTVDRKKAMIRSFTIVIDPPALSRMRFTALT